VCVAQRLSVCPPPLQGEALGLYAAIRRHDRVAVDSLAGVAKNTALAEAEAKWET
jgi:hypothetical protein